jgi:hypothetical protein
VSHKPVACNCDDVCRVCAWEETDHDAIALHNLRVACHGERKYPGRRITPFPDWTR